MSTRVGGWDTAMRVGEGSPGGAGLWDQGVEEAATSALLQS